MDQPSASVATVRSFKESARNSTAIFPALQFSCSGIVTHFNMSFVNRTELCSMMRGGFSSPTTFHIQLSVWGPIGQNYRYLGEHRVGVAVEEVIRQCDLQQLASVAVQFTLDSQLLVQPGYTIGFHYPFVYSFSTLEANINQVFGGVTPKSLGIEFVEATSAVAILTKKSEITLNTIVTVEQSQFSIAPKVGFSIDGQCGIPSPHYRHPIAYRSLNCKHVTPQTPHNLYPFFFVVCSLLCGSFRVCHLSLDAARPHRHPLCHTAGWLLHGDQHCSSVHCFALCVKETAKQSKEWWNA